MKELSPFKIFNYLDRVDQLIKTGDTIPITVEIDPINTCNHSCIYCADSKSSHDGQTLSVSFIKNILIQLKDFGVKGVVYKGGGEPTLNTNLLKFIEMTKEREMKTAMLSNGSSLIDNSDLQECILKNLEYIRISLDAISKESHEYWHRSNDWDDITNGIIQLVKLKEILKSKCLIGINILYDNRTYNDLPRGVRLAEKLGIDILSFRKAYQTSYGFKNSWTEEELKDEKNMRNYIKSIPHKLKHVMIDGSRGHEIDANEEDNLRYCLPVPLTAIICADMKVYPCCDLRLMSDYVLGDLSINSFSEIWNSEQRKKVMEKIKCKTCYKMCTHRFAYYNQLFNYLIDTDKPHVELI